MNFLYAQKIGTFQHTYGGNGDSHEGSSVVALPDKGFLIGGNVDFSVGEKILIIRTDSLGRQVWAKTFSGTGNSGYAGADMVLSPEGNVVVCSSTNNGQAIYLFKINLKGSVLWSKTFPGWVKKIGATFGTFIINARGGGYLITGTANANPNTSGNTGEAVVIKTDTAGKILWSNIYYQTGYAGMGYQITPSRSGGYLITGVSRDTIGPGVLYLVIKISRSGKLVWSKAYGEPYTQNNGINDISESSVELPDKSIYVCGQGSSGSSGPSATILKLDSSGNLLWSKIYISSKITNLYFSTSLYDSINKTINIICQFNGTGSTLRGVVRVDTSGKIIFSKTLGPSYIKRVAQSGRGHDFIPLVTGGYAMIQSDILSAKFGYDFFLIKMDSGANSNHCNTSVFSISPSYYPAKYLFSDRDSSVTFKVDSGCTVANIGLNDSLYCDPFIAAFGWQNPCTNQKTQFLDSSYAHPIHWKWDFGDTVGSSIGANADTSTLKNPVHIYSHPGTYRVKLISSNSNDTDSISKTITIYPSPTPVKYFDTLICGGSTIKLQAKGGDTYLWKPGGYTSDTPRVTLYKTRTYIVQAIANNGCITKDTVHITVDNRPNPPVIKYTTVKSLNEIDLSFQKSDSNDVKSYAIYRSDNGGTYQKIATFINLSNANKTYFYADTSGLHAASNNYSYHIVAIDSCGGGIDTSTSHQPVLLKGNGGEFRSVLSWTTYNGYAYDTAIVQRYDTVGHKWINLAYLGNKDSAYTDSSYLKCNKTVYYRILTKLKDGYASYSDSIFTIPYETVFKDTPQIITVTKTSTSTSNGTVMIRWKNKNTRVQYNELYYSADGIKFNLLKDSLPPSLDSFIHTGVNTQSADQYYYIQGLDSCPAKSPKSVIHKTMTLTVSIGELLHKLNWTPYLGFKIKEYKIEKLVGNAFVAIDSVPGTDTFSKYFPAPCNHVERYMIEAVGYNPGTVSEPVELSFSDSMGRKALDTIPPDAPIIKNATVVNDTTSRIDFIGSDSLKTYNFIIQRSVDGVWGTAGTVLFTGPGKAVTYIDSNINTVKNHLCYTVIARDSCLNVTPSDTFCVILLKGSAQNLSDSLKWSPYIGYAIGHYDILRYAGPGKWDTVGTVNGTDNQYLDKPLSCNVPVIYKIEGIQKGGGYITFSDSITLTPFDTIKPPAPIIKYATVLNSNQIELYWHKSIPKVKLYELSIKTGNGSWIVADSIYSDTSFIFNGLRTTDSVYDFWVVAIDSCSLNRSENSAFHSPVKIKGTALDDTVKLNWKSYEGFASVQKYYIYSLVNGQWSMTDSVTGNTNTWISKTLPCNVPQAYKIGAMDNTGLYLSQSDTVQVIPFDTIKPQVPQLNYVTVLPDQTVKLGWKWDTKSDVKYFEMWRSTNHTAPVLIDTVIYDSIFIDKAVDVKSNVYSYQVIAIDSCNTNNRSKPSVQDTIFTLKLYSLYCSPQVSVSWKPYHGLPNSPVSYEILRSEDGTDFSGIATLNASATNYIDASVSLGKTYFYKIKAIDSKSGFSSFSDSLGIIPRLIPDADTAQIVYATVMKSDEVSGAIYVKWKRAAVNDTNARGYYLYSYNSSNGKYALLKDITDLNDTTYINSNINTIKDIFKYYVITYNVCDVGINSNIHRTILLNVQDKNLSEQLNWIYYLGVPVKNYSIYKSIDGGSQNLVNDVGTDSSYLDSNIACNHNVTYQIQAMLSNGEISFSDSITVKSYDTIKPKTEPLILATVVRTGLTDGKIEIDWNRGIDHNLLGYNVYRSIDGFYWSLVIGHWPGTSLIDSGLDTYDYPYYYKIQPIDSCGNVGTNTIYHETINLKARSGNGYNQLAWNGYVGWPVKRYLVYRDGILIDTLPGSMFQFKDTAIICHAVYQYIIKAVDADNDTIISASNTDSAKAANHITPQKVYIKTVTVSKPNKSATITWTASKSYDVKDYMVYRKDFETGNLKFIDSTTKLILVDTSKNIIQPDCYYVFARDHCDNISNGSNEGCIIILDVKASNGNNQLTWNSYQNWPDGVQTYNVYKNEDSTGWQLIGVASPLTPLPGREEFDDKKLGDSTIDFCYQVEAVENPGQYNQISRSTVECVHQDATVFIPNSFTPYNQDGVNDLFGPKGIHIKNYDMKIYNRWGECVFASPQPSPGGEGGRWDGTFKGQPVQQGIYIYMITVTDYNGKQSYFRGTVTMFE